MVAPFSGAGQTVRPDRIEGAEEGDPEEERKEEGDPAIAEGEEKRDANILRKPQEPTQKEWEEHMVLHWPFRSWCPHCVNGKAQGEWHRKSADKEEHGIPTIYLDYMYMIAEDNKDKEDKTVSGMPILV